MNKRKLVGNLLKSSIRRVSMSWQIYVSICIVILSTIPTYIDNIEWYNLNNMLAIGANNRFIFSFIVDNHYLPILGPVIAILPYSCSIFEDRKSSYINNIVIRTSPQLGPVKFFLYISVFRDPTRIRWGRTAGSAVRLLTTVLPEAGRDVKGARETGVHFTLDGSD